MSDTEDCYEITLSTEEGNDYLVDFLNEPLRRSEVVILFEFDTKGCFFYFYDGTSLLGGWEDDWEEALAWLSSNGYKDEVAKINLLAENKISL